MLVSDYLIIFLIMNSVKIYTTSYCPYCVKAKQFFDDLGVEYEEIDVEQDSALRDELAEKYSWRTVPMIVVNGEFLGGYEDVRSLHAEGKLLSKISPVA